MHGGPFSRFPPIGSRRLLRRLGFGIPVDTRVVRALRGFVVASLLGGGALLLAFARIVQVAAEPWVYFTAILWAAALVLLTMLRVGPHVVPSASLIASLLLGIAWAHLESNGHLVLSALGPVAAILAGIGLARGDRWAWPVGLVVVAGIGPLFLTFVPLPTGVYAAAMALLVADAIVLLLIRDGPAGAARTSV